MAGSLPPLSAVNGACGRSGSVLQLYKCHNTKLYQCHTFLSELEIYWPGAPSEAVEHLCLVVGDHVPPRKFRQ